MTIPSVTPWGSGPLSVVVVDGEGSVSLASNVNFVHETTPLGASASFTSAWGDSKPYATVVLTIFADQAGVLEFQWSADGANVDRTETTNYTVGATGRAFALAVRGSFLRIKYTNGGIAQTVFRLCATLHHNGTGIITKPLTSTISDDNFSQLVSGVNVGRHSDGSYSRIVLDDARKFVPVSNLGVTATAVADSGVTLTLPATAARYHYISNIEITKYASDNNAGDDAPVVVTSTNLPGDPAWSFSTSAGKGDAETRSISSMLRSLVINTDTTIVCPATSGVLWRATAFYHEAA